MAMLARANRLRQVALKELMMVEKNEKHTEMNDW